MILAKCHKGYKWARLGHGLKHTPYLLCWGWVLLFYCGLSFAVRAVVGKLWLPVVLPRRTPELRKFLLPKSQPVPKRIKHPRNYLLDMNRLRRALPKLCRVSQAKTMKPC